MKDNGTTKRPARDIADIYELSPIQQGMLYEQLAQPGIGVYVEQLRLEFSGTMHPEHFERAWQLVVDRHPIVRSSFHWRKNGTAMQVVHATATLPLETLDWRDLGEPEQEERLTASLEAERAAGFDLTDVPLMRSTLIRRAEDRWTFSWRFSHLLMDGWSFTLAIQDFIDNYRSLCSGGQPSAAPGQPYRDYLSWWRQRDSTAAREFWRRELAGYQPVEQLYLGGGDVPRGRSPHAHFERLLTDLAPRLNALARSEQLTLATLAQGAWFLVLGRFLGRDDLVCGITMAHRPPDLVGSDDILGPMIATLPLRRRLDPTAVVGSWLRDFGRHVIEASQHSEVPLAEMPALLGMDAGVPLLPSSVSYENVPMPDFDLADVGAEMTGLSYDGRPHFPITMVIMPGEDMPLRVVYDRRKVADDVAERFADEVVSVLTQFVEHPERTLGELSFRSAPRPEDTALAEPPSECLHETFRRHALARPEAIAVSFGDRTVTYRELDERSDRIAAALRDRHPGAARVGLCLPRSTDLVAAMIGVFKAGAAYVPLDPNYPPERLADMLADSGAELVLTDADTSFNTGDVQVITPAEVDGQPVTDGPRAATDPDAPAYLLYTSGSTGRPKGVPVTHRNVQSLLSAGREVFGFAAEDVWTFAHSFAFDYSVWEIWGALANGARLVVVPEPTGRDPRALARLIDEERVTVLSETPSLFEHLVAELPDDPALRKVFLGGDRLDPVILRPWFARFAGRGVELYNLYGVTEATVVSTYHLVRAEDVGTDQPIPIGRALPNQRVHLLDEHDRPVPVGATGELCVAGPAVAAGYHARAELTAQRFGTDPGTGADRMYRTGDLATSTSRGELRFLGRADSQVKVRGFRVELGEIEAVLREAPGVRAATAAVRGPNRITGYVVPEQPDAASAPRPADQVLDFVRTRLPEHMVPVAVHWIDRIPTTPGGKVDLAALPAPDGVPDGEFLAPRTETEQLLARLLSEVLELPRVGAGDVLGELGLHSLGAMRLTARLRSEHALDLALADLLAARTVAELASAVDAVRPVPAGEAR
ncbi:amino acid adenylation domain-containing protein [Saccharopolyspora indica]|uniref:non-ribosomal peptide synthetase n=1 Tax=Saccharopolyspora indica TaxID=1229659 RepID=UPI0022EA6E37|nr:amino acid adenylation domain-containing protein [Saccharopolyspora indica]MDA3648675.1 amino acid adenylation domain-containing protein [Saccharopolyspora indica]